jgi:hypothetical protein
MLISQANHSGFSERKLPKFAGAHRLDGKRFVCEPMKKLTAFMKLESAIRASGAIVLDERTAVFPD